MNADKIDDGVDQEYNRGALIAHNQVRRYHGAPPLAIDWKLANGA